MRRRAAGVSEFQLVSAAPEESRNRMSPKMIGRYVLAGLLIGAIWYLNRARPPWEEALRTFVTFAVLVFVMRQRLRRRSIQVHVGPLLAGKAVLVALAAVAQGALVGAS